MKEQLVKAFQSAFGHGPDVVTRAPGRLEMLGNHTDYNEGLVLSVAVNRESFVAAARREGTTCTIRDVQYETESVFEVDQLKDPVSGDWANYVKGLIVELQQRGLAVPAFDAVLTSTVPLSAGMSSSAALEMSFALALGELGDITLPWQEWARVGQAAENNYVGARTGLLDQFSSIRGKQGHLVFSDFRTLEVRNVPLPSGTALVVANSMVKHTLTQEYNERREACERAVSRLAPRIPGVTALRDVSRAQLEQYRDELDDLTFRRALHIAGENERVVAGAAALEANDVQAFGRLMFESHESSRVNFENSCPELDAMVDIGRSLPGSIGARLSGGGFGGITVHLVAETAAEAYSASLANAYQDRSGICAQVMTCQTTDGASLL